MSWYYDRTLGNIAELTGWQKWEVDREIDLEKLSEKAGVPRRIFGPYATQAEAEAAKQQNPSVADNAKNAVKAVTDIPGAIASFGNQLVKLATRMLEAAAGIVLLAIAANAILKAATGVDVAATAARTGRRAAAAAAKVA